MPSGSGSPCSEGRMGTSSGDRDSPQAAVALSAEVRCFVCVRCVCVCDRHRGPTAEHTSGLLLGCGPRTPQPWSNLEPRLESWELGPMASCFPGARPRPSCACSYLGRCGKECSEEGPGPRPGTWPTCTAWEGRGSRSLHGHLRQRENRLPGFPELCITNA